jgi:hypothetical protein
MRDKSYQREMQEREAIADPRKRDTGAIDYDVETIGKAEAAAFIKRFEYLGTVGNPAARYCARDGLTGDVAAVAILSAPVNVQAAGLCRKLDPRNLSEDDLAYLATVCCLERGACAHWAHEHTASWFITRVLARAHAEHGYKIFYGYSDPDAGETGGVYMACGWHYLGVGPGRRLGHDGKPQARWQFRKDGGKWINDRTFYERGLGLTVADARAGVDGWEWREVSAKGKFVQFVVGDKRGEYKALMRALRYPVVPYVKWDL